MAETVLDSLVVKIEADTRGLEAGINQTTASLKGLESFAGSAQASTLELGSAAGGMARDLEMAADSASNRMAGSFARMARSGQLSFDGLRDSALSAVADIAASLLSLGVRNIFSSLLPSVFLPGRATGGAVSPGQAYMVGEHGPELFVPQSTGRISSQPGMARANGGNRPVNGRGGNITINVQGAQDSEGLRQSSAQVALAVRRALMRADRSL